MTDLFDPWSEWGGVVEHSERVAALSELKSEEGGWPNPASIARFNVSQMPYKMLRRFLAKIEISDLDFDTPCWIWTGGTHDKGYGRFYLGRDPETDQKIWAYSHRIAFEHWVGFPPLGYIVDHQCNHKLCCNPSHLWPVTNDENLRLADQRRPWKRRNQYSKE